MTTRKPLGPSANPSIVKFGAEKRRDGSVVWSKSPNSKAQKSRWNGDLAKPFKPAQVCRPRGFLVPLASDSDADRIIAQENVKMVALIEQATDVEETRKLALVAENYNVPVDDFRAIALALAREFVPGFRFDAREKAGRPKDWDDERHLELVADIGAEKDKSKLDDLGAIRKLAITKKWGRPVRSQSLENWVQTLQSRLYAGRQLVKPAAAAFQITQPRRNLSHEELVQMLVNSSEQAKAGKKRGRKPNSR